MTSLLEAVADLDELREKAEQIEDLVTPPAAVEERVKPGGMRSTRAERRDAWHRRVEDAVLDLSNSMPKGVEDYDVRKLLGIVVELRRMLDADPEVRDEGGLIELTTMRAADVAARLTRRLVHEQLDDPRIAVKLVLESLKGISISDIAHLLGVSTKTVRAWQHENPVRQNVFRVILVAQLLTYLRSSMTPRGVLMWFDAERDQLDGRTPMELLDESAATAYPVLLDLARGARGQLAG